MPARKKTTKKVAKKSAHKSSSKSTSSSKKAYLIHEREHLIIIGGIVAIVLFILGSILIERAKEQKMINGEYVNIEAPQTQDSSPSAQ